MSKSSCVEFEFDFFAEIRVASIVGLQQRVAVVGSRSVRDRDDILEFVKDFSNTVASQRKCAIISGGAYGADQAGMEGALGILPRSLDPIIPISTKNENEAHSLIAKLTKETPLIDYNECAIVAKQLTIYYPNFRNGYSPIKYFERDKKIVIASDIVIAFWDGVSSGTRATIGYATKTNKRVIVVKTK